MNSSNTSITEYRILTANSASDLQLQVEKFINLGYIPLGGVAISHAVRTNSGNCDAVFTQAIVKYKSIRWKTIV